MKTLDQITDEYLVEKVVFMKSIEENPLHSKAALERVLQEKSRMAKRMQGDPAFRKIVEAWSKSVSVSIEAVMREIENDKMFRDIVLNTQEKRAIAMEKLVQIALCEALMDWEEVNNRYNAQLQTKP